MKFFKRIFKHVGKTFAMAGFTTFMMLTVSPSIAAEGHDHGEEPAIEAGETLPRFAAASESFELVGVVNGKQVTLYLDRFADNSPVKDAKIELELGGNKLPVESHAEGEYETTLKEALKPGVLPVVASVTVDEDADLLAGELDMREKSSTSETKDIYQQRWWGKPLFKVFTAFFTLALIGWGVWLVRARRKKSRDNQQGDAV